MNLQATFYACWELCHIGSTIYLRLGRFIAKKNKMAQPSVITAVAIKEKTPIPPIDRKEICPFLLRVFTNTGRPYHVSEFSRGSMPPNQVSIYTCPAGCGYHNNKDIYQVATSFMFDETFRMDATLKELAGLIKQMNPDARKKGTFIDFYVVYPSSIPGRWLQRDIGSVCVGRKGTDDLTTLKEKRFQIGDYLSVAITYSMGTGGIGPRLGDRRMRPY